jgi:hypothetical protein
MKLNNKSEYTINFTRKALNTISKHANLDEPEQVKMFIALLKNARAKKSKVLSHASQPIIHSYRYALHTNWANHSHQLDRQLTNGRNPSFPRA